MKKLLIILMLAVSTCAYADNKTDNATTPKVDLVAEVAKITSLEAVFEQINTIEGFGNDVYSGEVYIDMKKRAIWDYKEPYVTWYLFSDKMVEQYDEVNNQLMRYPMTEDADSVVLQVLMDFSSLPKAFDVKQINDNALRLEPKRDIGLKFMLIEFDAGIISAISSEDMTGNKTKIFFSEVRTNIDIPESVYLKELPKDVEIFDIKN